MPETLAASRQRLAETMEMVVLDDLSEGGLSFRGAPIYGPSCCAAAKVVLPQERSFWEWPRPWRRHGDCGGRSMNRRYAP